MSVYHPSLGATASHGGEATARRYTPALPPPLYVAVQIRAYAIQKQNVIFLVCLWFAMTAVSCEVESTRYADLPCRGAAVLKLRVILCMRVQPSKYARFSHHLEIGPGVGGESALQLICSRE